MPLGAALSAPAAGATGFRLSEPNSEPSPPAAAGASDGAEVEAPPAAEPGTVRLKKPPAGGTSCCGAGGDGRAPPAPLPPAPPAP